MIGACCVSVRLVDYSLLEGSTWLVSALALGTVVAEFQNTPIL